MALTALSLKNTHPLVAPEPLDFLVIDHPALHAVAPGAGSTRTWSTVSFAACDLAAPGGGRFSMVSMGLSRTQRVLVDHSIVSNSVGPLLSRRKNGGCWSDPGGRAGLASVFDASERFGRAINSNDHSSGTSVEFVVLPGYHKRPVFGVFQRSGDGAVPMLLQLCRMSRWSARRFAAVLI